MKKTLILSLILFIIFIIAGISSQNKNDKNSEKQENNQSNVNYKNIFEEKFNQSSKATIKEFNYSDGNIILKLSDYPTYNNEDKEGLNLVVIDVVIAINRNIEKFKDLKQAEVYGKNYKIFFTRELFDKYATGKINDIQFMSEYKIEKI